MILGVRGGLKREREYSVMYGKIVGGVEVAKYFCLIYSLEPLYSVRWIQPTGSLTLWLAEAGGSAELTLTIESGLHFKHYRK